MPEKDARLLAKLIARYRLSRAACSALTHPIQSVLHGTSDAYRKLVETDAAARVKYEAAIVALREYRTNRKNRILSSGLARTGCRDLP